MKSALVIKWGLAIFSIIAFSFLLQLIKPNVKIGFGVGLLVFLLYMAWVIALTVVRASLPVHLCSGPYNNPLAYEKVW